MPGTRSRILYWPALSDTTLRVFSMSEGLAASTVTPGRIAPLVSLTTPAIDAWAELSRGMRNTAALSRTKHDNARRILPPVVGGVRPKPRSVNGRPGLLASGETIAVGIAEDNQIRWAPTGRTSRDPTFGIPRLARMSLRMATVIGQTSSVRLA